MSDDLVERVEAVIARQMMKTVPYEPGDRMYLNVARAAIAVVLEEAAKVAQRIADEEAVKCRDAFEEDREMALRHSDTSGGAASAAAAIRALVKHD